MMAVIPTTASRWNMTYTTELLRIYGNQGRVVAKAYPDGSRCSYCCGLTFEVFVRAMKLRNMSKGLARDDFNGMDFYDLFNLLQIWYIEGKGDSPRLGIVKYGLGRAIENWEEAKAGDFCDFSRNNRTGHSVIFVEWKRDEAGKIIGMKYFSSNSSGVGYGTEYFFPFRGKVTSQVGASCSRGRNRGIQAVQPAGYSATAGICAITELISGAGIA